MKLNFHKTYVTDDIVVSKYIYNTRNSFPPKL